MAITQLSLFLTNKPGALVEAVSAIADAGANLRAMSIAEANDFGILRIIVTDSEKICNLLRESYLVSKTEVVAARMDDRSGALYPILAALNEVNINIEYMYAFTGSGPEQAYVVLRVNDVKTAEEVLSSRGIDTLSDDSLKL
ncbi:MAG: ACT domain-containing protein [Clostridiales bacterium]|nr:ACT domain-containing protein [Clostridiales bacterium]